MDIIVALNRIIKAFKNSIEIKVTKTRWEEIKKLQNKFDLDTSSNGGYISLGIQT